MAVKKKIDKIFEASEKRAAAMTEEEIDAALGPATRRFFALAERIEAWMTLRFPNAGQTLVLWIGAWLAGWLYALILGAWLAHPIGYLGTAFWILLLGFKTGLGDFDISPKPFYYMAFFFFGLAALLTTPVAPPTGYVFFVGIPAYLFGWLLRWILFAFQRKTPDTQEKTADTAAVPSDTHPS